MKNVLVIAYYFPPLANSGVYRTVKFVKHLQQYGWQPYVLTTTELEGSFGSDNDLLGEISDSILVSRETSPSPKPYTWMSQLLARGKSEPFATNSDEDRNRNSSNKKAGEQSDNRSLVTKIKRALGWPLHQIEYPIIDPQIYWSIKIIPLAIRLIQMHRIELVYTSSAPFSTLITGMLLKAMLHRPWIADFRDPWTFDTILYHTSGMRSALNQYLERKALSYADRVICVNNDMATKFAKLLPPEDNKAKVQIITNGFDLVDFDRDNAHDRNNSSDVLALAHLGTVVAGPISSLIHALAVLGQTDAGRVTLTRLKFDFWGHYWNNLSSDELLENLHRSGKIQFHKAVSHRDAIAIMQSVDILLFMNDDGPYWATVHRGKIFEYIASGTPILAISPEGVATQLIAETCTGVSVRSTDYIGLASLLEEIVDDYDGFREKYYHPKWEIISQFDRRVLTGELAREFDAVTRI